MIKNLKKYNPNKSLFKILSLTSFFISLLYPIDQNAIKAGLEFQWDENDNFKRLKWHQTDNRKRSKNKIFFFLRPSDRRTGFLKINMRLPKSFKSTLKEEKITLCRVRIGGFENRTKCLENIPADIEVNRKTKSIDIFPYNPIPSSTDSYAIVFKITNPQKSGLYQFHSYGQSSGKIPVSSYIGSWTIRIAGQ